MTNSHGNTSKDIRKFLRECGEKPTMERVEEVQREVSRTQSQNEQVDRIAKEMGLGTHDRKGKVTRERIERKVSEEQKRRGR